MNYTLQELIDLFNSQSITIAKHIKASFNNIVPTANAIDDTKANIISKMLVTSLEQYLHSETIFDNADKGIFILKSMFKTHIFSIVMEYDRIDKSLNKPLMTQHTQSRLNPINNQDVETSATKIDDTQFNYLDNYNAKMELLGNSSAVVGLKRDILSILDTVGF